VLRSSGYLDEKEPTLNAVRAWRSRLFALAEAAETKAPPTRPIPSSSRYDGRPWPPRFGCESVPFGQGVVAQVAW